MGSLLLSSVDKKFTVYHNKSILFQWELTSHLYQNKSFSLAKNKQNPQIIAQIHLCYQTTNINQCLQISQFRHKFISKEIVGVYGIYQNLQRLHNNSTICCGKLSNYLFVVEHMKYCLADLGQISFQKGLLILKNSFKGAQLIKSNLNILTLYDPNMIFFDSQDNCKIWINSDISCLQQQFQVPEIKEDDSVQSIFECVEQKICDCLYFQNYLKEKQAFKAETFKQALQFLSHYFSVKERKINHHQQMHVENYNENQNKFKEIQIKAKTLQKNQSKTSLSVKKLHQINKQIYLSDKNISLLNSKRSSILVNIPTIIQKGQNLLELKLSSKKKETLHFNNIKNQLLKVNIQKPSYIKSYKPSNQQSLLQQNSSNHLRKRTIKKNQISLLFISSERQKKVEEKPLSVMSTNYQDLDYSDNIINQSTIFKRQKLQFNKQIPCQAIKFSKMGLQTQKFLQKKQFLYQQISNINKNSYYNSDYKLQNKKQKMNQQMQILKNRPFNMPQTFNSERRFHTQTFNLRPYRPTDSIKMLTEKSRQRIGNTKVSLRKQLLKRQNSLPNFNF